MYKACYQYNLVYSRCILKLSRCLALTLRTIPIYSLPSTMIDNEINKLSQCNIFYFIFILMSRNIIEF